MIDIENAKKELVNHVNEIQIDNPRVQMKVGHIIRVAENCKKLATNLKLTEEQIQLAELIGLLHDIGRFEQYKILDKDKKEKFDHGEAGVEVLKKDNYIRKYIEEDMYDDTIYTAVYEHNKYQLSEGLSQEKELFCKIIRDADKLDLIYEGAVIYWEEPERMKQVEEGRLSKKMLEDVYQTRLADGRNKISETDQVLRFASYVFDVNFSYSFKVLKKNDYVSKMIDKFHYQISETKDQMMKVKKIVNEYIVDNIH